MSTAAGTGSAGYVNGPSNTAQFSSPSDICDDGAGNIFVADTNNYRIRSINVPSLQGISYQKIVRKKISLIYASYLKSKKLHFSREAGLRARLMVNIILHNSWGLLHWLVFLQPVYIFSMEDRI